MLREQVLPLLSLVSSVLGVLVIGHILLAIGHTFPIMHTLSFCTHNTVSSRLHFAFVVGHILVVVHFLLLGYLTYHPPAESIFAASSSQQEKSFLWFA